MELHKDYWRSIFMIPCWYLWNWRNKALFEEGFHRPINPTETVTHLVKEIETRIWVQTNVRSPVLEIKHVQWYHREGNWIKLNCDGVYKKSNSILRCVGLLRDSTGNWVTGYPRKKGFCDALATNM